MGDPEMEETAHQEMVTAPLPPPEEGRVDNLLFSFVFVHQNFNRRAVSSVSRSQEEESCELCITGLLPSSSLASGQQWVAQKHPSCPFVEPGKCNTRVPASCRHTRGCHKAQAGFLPFLPHEEESGECYTSHLDPAPCLPSVAPLVPMVQSLRAWLALPSPTRWLLQTFRLFATRVGALRFMLLLFFLTTTP